MDGGSADADRSQKSEVRSQKSEVRSQKTGDNDMNARVFAAINDQINSEFQASYTYLAMAGFCDRQKFLGAAQWLRMQSDEERQHGMKLFDFVLARDGAVELQAIEQPSTSYDSLAAVFEQTLTHEQTVTAQINSLYEL